MTTEKASELLDRIQNLSKGDQTALKRALGQALHSSSGRAQAALYKVHFGYGEQAGFLAATAVCYLGLEDAAQGGKGSLGDALLGYKAREKLDGGDSIDNKLAALLDVRMDSQEEFLCAKLGRIIRMLKQKDCIPNYVNLIADITSWDSESRFVQRKWAKDYYGFKVKE